MTRAQADCARRAPLRRYSPVTGPALGGAVGERRRMVERLKRPFVVTRRFFKDVWMELQRVVWPDHEQNQALTGVVIVAVTIVALWVAVLDLIFSRLVAAFRLYD